MTRPGRKDRLLERLAAADPEELEALHEDLVARAEAEGLLDVAYRILDSPVGPLLLAATEEGLLRVAFEQEGFDAVLGTISAQLSPRILLAPQRLDRAAGQLSEYFAGDRQRFELPLDLRMSTGFRRTVLGYLPSIDYGRTLSYGDVAAALRRPGAARAVGSACATNPLPLVIPCHRVIRSDGVMGSYLGGAATKQQLLELEAAA